MSVNPGTRVRVHYAGTLDDGTEFDSSHKRGPLEFTVGAGEVIDGFDAAVAGLSPGEMTKIRVEAAEAYGARVEEAVQRVGLDAFGEPPSVGDTVNLIAPDGNSIRATVTAVEEETAELDFNHPLAGQALNFELELVEIVESP